MSKAVPLIQAIDASQARTLTPVRKVSYSVGVERIFPLNSPRIEKVEVQARGHVRRAKLYYLRDLAGKKSRLRETKKHR